MRLTEPELDLVVDALKVAADKLVLLSRKILHEPCDWPKKVVFERSAELDTKSRETRALAQKITDRRAKGKKQ